MAHGIMIDTQSFFASHGREPAGGENATWVFLIGDEEVSFLGAFEDACAQARAYARKFRVRGRVEVLP